MEFDLGKYGKFLLFALLLLLGPVLNRANAVEKPERLKGNTAKASINEKGLYFLPAEDLSECMNFNGNAAIEMIKTGNLHLSNRGEEIAWLAAADHQGVYFFGERIDDLFTDTSIYWIARKKGRPMKQVPSPAFSGMAFHHFSETIHMEEDKWPLTTIFDDPLCDYWMWEYLVAGNAGTGVRTFSFSVPGPADGNFTAEARIYLKGASDTFPGLDHHVRVYVNDTLMGESRWDGFDQLALPVFFDQGLLFDGTNTIKVTAVRDAGVFSSIFYLNAFDIVYQRTFTALNDQLFFTGSGNDAITVSGFSSPDIMVFDITDSKKPEQIIDSIIETGPGGYQVSFVTGNPAAQFLALTQNRVKTPLRIAADHPSRLSSPSNRADYVIITPREFGGGALRLAEYRNEYHTMVVFTDDIYDEFNFGLASPYAIRDFLNDAHHTWSLPPDRVVLVGNGSYDYKDHMKNGDCLVPPFMVATPDGLFPADNRFADVEGDDGLPDMAVGRLPVMTAAELDVMLDKIEIFERGIRKFEPWNNRVVMVADNPDGAGNFPADSDSIAAIVPPTYQVDKIYLGHHPLNTARILLQDAFNQGAFLINYIGHSGLYNFANEGLLTTEDVNQLTNPDRLPIVAAMTCLMGNFGIPGYTTLSEALLTGPGGAAAVWTSTGYSYNSKGRVLDAGFFDAIFAGGRDTLGDAVMDALAQYRQRHDEVFIIDIYHLLGDPGLKIR